MVPRTLHTSVLVFYRSYLIAIPVQAGSRSAGLVLDRCVESLACCTARCSSQLLDLGVQVVACGAARYLSQVLDRVALLPSPGSTSAVPRSRRGLAAAAAAVSLCIAVLNRAAQAVTRCGPRCLSKVIK